MASSSDREGFCLRCGCANGSHLFGQCGGRVNGFPCNFEWMRCTISGHEDYVDGQYVDCYRCWQHPGAPPGHFWGTQPDDDDEDQVLTADEIGLPYPEMLEELETGADMPEAGPSSGHTRTFSTETVSTDPLQWDEARYEQATADVSSLAQRLENVQLQDNSSSNATPLYVNTHYSSHQRRICFRTADGSEVRTRESEWESTYAEYEGQMVPCFLYSNQSGQFYTWTHGTGDASAEGGKSKDKDKDKKRKDKKGKGHKR